MPPYCTKDDVLNRYHDTYVRKTLGANDAPAPLTQEQVRAIETAIDDAGFTIDSILAQRYAVPFPGGPDNAPKIVRTLCATIAGASFGRHWPGNFNNDAWRRDIADALNMLHTLRQGHALIPDAPTLARYFDSLNANPPRTLTSYIEQEPK